MNVRRAARSAGSSVASAISTWRVRWSCRYSASEMLRKPCAFSAMPGIGSSLFTLPAASTSRSYPSRPRPPSESAYSSVRAAVSTVSAVPSKTRTRGSVAVSETATWCGSRIPPVTWGRRGR